MTDGEIIGPGYWELLAQIKSAVVAARGRAARVVNREMIELHWEIGRLILDRQDAEGWGTKVISRLSTDLRTEFPGMRGFGTRRLVYMRTFAAAYPDGITQQPVAQLPWRHITTLLDRVPDRRVRDWYATQDVQHGWSTAVLSHHITTGRHERIGIAPSTRLSAVSRIRAVLVVEFTVFVTFCSAPPDGGALQGAPWVVDSGENAPGRRCPWR